MANTHSRIIVALDNVGIFKDCMKWAEQLSGHVAGFKLNDALDLGGTTLCTAMKQFGEVMADPKLHDIPNTMRNRAQLYDIAGCDSLTVHASNTHEALCAAVEAAPKTMVLGVTVLTSINEDECKEIYYDRGRRAIDLSGGAQGYVGQKVVQFAKRSQRASLGGIVCSPMELALLGDLGLLTNLKAVVPGVRSAGADTHDQKRVMTPAEAIQRGAHRIVVGREILGAKDPIDAAKRINDDVAAVATV